MSLLRQASKLEQNAAFGKWYAQIKSLETMNTRRLAQHIRFLPEQTTEENISSREFLKKAEFINIDQLMPKEEEATNSGNSSDSPTNDSPTNDSPTNDGEGN